MQQLGQRVHRDARGENRHHGKRHRVEATGPLVEAQFEVFRNRARFRSVIKRHHEDPQKDHGRDGAEPVEVAGRDAILRSAGSHADQFESAQVGGDEGQAGDPRRDGAPRQEEVGAGLHVTLQRETDSHHKCHVNQHDGIVDQM